MNKLNKQDLNAGFTLVELLVTVGILGILSSLAIGNFNNYRRRANDSLAIQQLVNFQTSYQAGFIDNPTFNPFEVGGSITFDVNGNSNTFGFLPPADSMLPGFIHQEGVALFFGLASSSDSSILHAAHCLGTSSNLGYGDLSTIFSVASGRSTPSGIIQPSTTGASSAVQLNADGSDCP